jgi:hypothetical protein
MPRSSHSSRFDHPKSIGEEYRSLSFSLLNFLNSPATTSLLGQNILLNIIFSNTISLRSTLSVSDQVSLPYKPTGKIIKRQRNNFWQNYTCTVTLDEYFIIKYTLQKSIKI